MAGRRVCGRAAPRLSNVPLAFRPSIGVGNSIAADCISGRRSTPRGAAGKSPPVACPSGYFDTGQRQRHERHLIDAESRIDLLQPHEAVGEEPGGDQQDQRQRDFADHQRRASARPFASAGRSRVRVPQRRATRRRAMPCSAGTSPTSSALAKRHDDRDAGDARIEPDLLERAESLPGSRAAAARLPSSPTSRPAAPPSAPSIRRLGHQLANQPAASRRRAPRESRSRAAVPRRARAAGWRRSRRQ